MNNISEIETILKGDRTQMMNNLIRMADSGTYETSGISVLYLTAIHMTIYDKGLTDELRKKHLQNLIGALLNTKGITPLVLFDAVPGKYLFQLLIDLRLLLVDIRPFLTGVDMNFHENDLSILRTLGDFSNDSFVDGLRFFYLKLDESRHRNAIVKIALACALAYNLNAVRKLLFYIEDTSDTFKVLEAAMTACLERKDLRVAVSLIGIADDVSVNAALIESLAEYYLEHDMYDQAIGIITEHKDKLVELAVTGKLIRYYIRLGKIDVVDLLIERAVDLSDCIDGMYMRAVFKAELAEIEMILGRKKELECRVEEVMNDIDSLLDFQYGCLAFSYLFSRLVINDYFPLADELLNRRWGISHKSSGERMNPNHDIEVKNALLMILKHISSLIIKNEVAGSAKRSVEIGRLYDTAHDAVLRLDDPSENRDYLLYEIGLSCAENGFSEKAYVNLRMMEDPDYKDHLSSEIPLWALNRRNMTGAVEFSGRIGIHKKKIETQLLMSPFLSKNGYTDEAFAFLNNWLLFTLRDKSLNAGFRIY